MPKKQTYTLNRVSYGSKKTPPTKREYRIGTGGIGGGTVGTKKEWRAWAKKNKVKVKFKE